MSLISSIIGSAANQFHIEKTNNGIIVAGYKGSHRNVTIPAVIDGLPVIGIKKDAFLNCKRMTSVTMPDSVISIGAMAFCYCCDLKTVTIPDSVTTIEEGVFDDCRSLVRIVIGKSVTSIGNFAFHYTSLVDITIPDSVTSIGMGAFWKCYCLDRVVMGTNVKSIGKMAFEECDKLQGVYFKGNAPSVEWNTFLNADKSTVYYLPETTGWTAKLGYRPTVLWNGVFDYLKYPGPDLG